MHPDAPTNRCTLIFGGVGYRWKKKKMGDRQQRQEEEEAAENSAISDRELLAIKQKLVDALRHSRTLAQLLAKINRKGATAEQRKKLLEMIRKNNKNIQKLTRQLGNAGSSSDSAGVDDRLATGGSLGKRATRSSAPKKQNKKAVVVDISSDSEEEEQIAYILPDDPNMPDTEDELSDDAYAAESDVDSDDDVRIKKRMRVAPASDNDDFDPDDDATLAYHYQDSDDDEEARGGIAFEVGNPGRTKTRRRLRSNGIRMRDESDGGSSSSDDEEEEEELPEEEIERLANEVAAVEEKSSPIVLDSDDDDDEPPAEDAHVVTPEKDEEKDYFRNLYSNLMYQSDVLSHVLSYMDEEGRLGTAEISNLARVNRETQQALDRIDDMFSQELVSAIVYTPGEEDRHRSYGVKRVAVDDILALFDGVHASAFRHTKEEESKLIDRVFQLLAKGRYHTFYEQTVGTRTVTKRRDHTMDFAARDPQLGDGGKARIYGRLLAWVRNRESKWLVFQRMEETFLAPAWLKRSSRMSKLVAFWADRMTAHVSNGDMVRAIMANHRERRRLGLKTSGDDGVGERYYDFVKVSNIHDGIIVSDLAWPWIGGVPANLRTDTSFTVSEGKYLLQPIPNAPVADMSIVKAFLREAGVFAIADLIRSEIDASPLEARVAPSKSSRGDRQPFYPKLSDEGKLRLARLDLAIKFSRTMLDLRTDPFDTVLDVHAAIFGPLTGSDYFGCIVSKLYQIAADVLYMRHEYDDQRSAFNLPRIDRIGASELGMYISTEWQSQELAQHAASRSFRALTAQERTQLVERVDGFCTELFDVFAANGYASPFWVAKIANEFAKICDNAYRYVLSEYSVPTYFSVTNARLYQTSDEEGSEKYTAAELAMLDVLKDGSTDQTCIPLPITVAFWLGLPKLYRWAVEADHVGRLARMVQLQGDSMVKQYFYYYYSDADREEFEDETYTGEESRGVPRKIGDRTMTSLAKAMASKREEIERLNRVDTAGYGEQRRLLDRIWSDASRADAVFFALSMRYEQLLDAWAQTNLSGREGSREKMRRILALARNMYANRKRFDATDNDWMEAHIKQADAEIERLLRKYEAMAQQQ
jgi:hypothetical protein